MQFERIFLVSAVLIFIALALGVSIGYSISPPTTRTTTIIQIQTLSTTLTETSPVTIIETAPTTITVVSPSGGQTYTVYTATSKIVQVLIYIPECVTSSGQSSTYVSTVQASIITTYFSPSGITYSGAVSFTTVTNTTVSISGVTQSESTSC